MDGWMDGSPQMWIQSDILLKKAILEAGQSILPLPLVRNFRRLTYQRYRCSLDPVETVARNDRRSNYRDQHFELGYSRLASVEIEPSTMIRVVWSLEEDSVPSDKYGDSRKKGRRGGGKRGWKIDGKRGFSSILVSYPSVHSCSGNQAIRTN